MFCNLPQIAKLLLDMVYKCDDSLRRAQLRGDVDRARPNGNGVYLAAQKRGRAAHAFYPQCGSSNDSRGDRMSTCRLTCPVQGTLPCSSFLHLFRHQGTMIVPGKIRHAGSIDSLSKGGYVRAHTVRLVHHIRGTMHSDDIFLHMSQLRFGCSNFFIRCNPVTAIASTTNARVTRRPTILHIARLDRPHRTLSALLRSGINRT